MFVHRLQSLGHQMGFLAYYGLEGGPLNLNNIQYYPKAGHPYGNDVVAMDYAHFRAQVLISLMDTWVMNVEEYPPGLRWMPWIPVDHDPLPAIVRNKIALAYKRISFSKHGVRMIHNAGLDCEYIPLGFDSRIFSPGDKMEARDRVKLPKDRWIVTTVAMNKGNPSRKGFAEMGMAYADFHRRHPDSFYFLQTFRGEAANDVINLPEMLRNFGLVEGKDFALCDPYLNHLGYPPPYIADLYRASDCMMLVSKGEGFGVPILEAQACACPVITSGWTANKELCYAGQIVDAKDAERWYTALASFQFEPHPAAISAALEQEWTHPTDATGAAAQVLAEYEAGYITEKLWKPLLEKVEAEVTK